MIRIIKNSCKIFLLFLFLTFTIFSCKDKELENNTSTKKINIQELSNKLAKGASQIVVLAKIS